MNQIKLQLEKVIKEAGKLFTGTQLHKEIIVKQGSSNFVTQIDYKVL